MNIPFACNSSKEKQLPTDSGRNFNLLLDTFNSNNCIVKQPAILSLDLMVNKSCRLQESQIGFLVHEMPSLTLRKLPIVSGKHVNKFPEMDRRSSLTSMPTVNRKHIHG